VPEPQDELRIALTKIENPGSFAVRREAPSSALRIEVKGVGPITFPVSPTRARMLCSVALLAHHGFKDQTRLDTRVRDTWEIPKSRIKIDQREWNQTLASELEQIQKGLGLPSGCKLRAELHNLLVYAPGQFFVPHQDSEKEDGMIGTLVVTLPSTFSGGAMVIKHHDQKVEYRGANRNISLVAFYADCHHEVRPVEEGYRIVLTYNLLLSPAEAEVSPAPAQVETLEGKVRAFFKAPRPARWGEAEFEPPPDRLVYLLDHQYSQKGLSWSHLKNGDGVRAATLRAVAERLDCDVALALADVHETWSCEDEEYGYGSSWGRRSRYDDAADELQFGEDGSEPALGELQNSEVELRHFVDAEGTAGVASGQVAEAELCYTRPSAGLEPFRSEHEGYMGNWGNTVDRWYHRAAVLLWPRQRTFIIRAKTSATYALDELTKSIRHEGAAKARSKAAELAPFWARVWHEASDSRLVEKTLRVAVELGSRELALSLVKPLRLEDLAPDVVPALISLRDVYGSTWFEQVLKSWQMERASDSDERRVRWLRGVDAITSELVAVNSAPARKLARRLVQDQWAWLSARLRTAARFPPSLIMKGLTRLEAPLLALLRSAGLVDRKLLEQMQRFLSSRDYPVQALAHFLEIARGMLDVREQEALGLGALGQHCASELERLLSTPLRSRDDWSFALPGDCPCELCAELSRFLAAPGKTKLEWPLAKDGRRHVHAVLDCHELPVNHTTRRSGRPFVLVLTKTQALFDREAAARVAWQLALDVLRKTGHRMRTRSPKLRKGARLRTTSP
jgi:hypothetical protein